MLARQAEWAFVRSWQVSAHAGRADVEDPEGLAGACEVLVGDGMVESGVCEETTLWIFLVGDDWN